MNQDAYRKCCKVPSFAPFLSPPFLRPLSCSSTDSICGHWFDTACHQDFTGLKPLGSCFSELPLSGDAEICMLHLHFTAMFCRVICFCIIACDILCMMVNEENSQWCIPFSARNKMPVGLLRLLHRARFLFFIFCRLCYSRQIM